MPDPQVNRGGDDPRVDWSQGDWLAETQRLEALLAQERERAEAAHKTAMHQEERASKAEKQRDEAEARAKRVEAQLKASVPADLAYQQVREAVAARDEALARVERAERLEHTWRFHYDNCYEQWKNEKAAATQAEAALEERRQVINEALFSLDRPGNNLGAKIKEARAALQSEPDA